MTEPKVLHQIIAIEKGVKSRVYSEVTKLHHASQKPELFLGIARSYEPINDQGERLPSENKRVTMNAEDILERVQLLQTEAWDIEGAKDWTNTRARADVVVEGRTLIKDAPATYLLFLEKQLSDLATFVDALPVLDDSDAWTEDKGARVYRADAVKTHRTRKVQRPIVLAPATDKHPAQTQLITEDVIDGHWTTIKMSGALEPKRKKAIRRRLERLSDAVKMAREKANSVAAEEVEVGDTMLAYLFESATP